MNVEKFTPFMNECIQRLFDEEYTESVRVDNEGDELFTFLGFIDDTPTMVRICPHAGFVEVHDIEGQVYDTQNNYWVEKVNNSFDCGDKFNCRSNSRDLMFGWLRFSYFERYGKVQD